MKNKVLEATVTGGNYVTAYPDYGGLSGDDDLAPGGSILGMKFDREMVKNRLTGAYPNHFVDNTDNWNWDIFPYLKGQEQKSAYDPSIALFNKKNSPIKRPDFDIWRGMNVHKKRNVELNPEKSILQTPEQDRSKYLTKTKTADNPEIGQDDGDKVQKTVNKHIKSDKITKL